MSIQCRNRSFHQNQNDYGLYTLCYQYLIKWWEKSDRPEYDLDADEPVHRATNGSEVRGELSWKDVEILEFGE